MVLALFMGLATRRGGSLLGLEMGGATGVCGKHRRGVSGLVATQPSLFAAACWTGVVMCVGWRGLLHQRLPRNRKVGPTTGPPCNPL